MFTSRQVEWQLLFNIMPEQQNGLTTEVFPKSPNLTSQIEPTYLTCFVHDS